VTDDFKIFAQPGNADPIQRVLLAGITGYLGGFIALELQKRGYYVRAIGRHLERLKRRPICADEAIEVDLTKPDTLEHCCKNVDTVISTVGITRQKDGLSYKDVDYQANMNLLQQAIHDNVKKFIYVSVLNGENLRQLKLCEAKEMFVDQLKRSGLEYCIIRPNGFFSDMTEFYEMAKKGRVYLFGAGTFKANPIHGEDLAEVCVDAVERSEPEVKVGGPDTLTHNEIAAAAFTAVGNPPKISHIPDWIRVAVLAMVRMFTGSRVYGPIEFFLTVMAMDMIAPEYGTHTLREYFNSLNRTNAV